MLVKGTTGLFHCGDDLTNNSVALMMSQLIVQHMYISYIYACFKELQNILMVGKYG